MEFDKYYQLQAEEGFPVYKGHPYMRGYGFGSVFKRFFRWIMPIVKENALPVVKNIGKEALKSVVNIANDTIEGKNFTESAKSNFKQSLNNLSDQFGGGNPEITSLTKTQHKKFLTDMRKKNSKRKKKRKLDIFD
jgi:hypothetical protein